MTKTQGEFENIFVSKFENDEVMSTCCKGFFPRGSFQNPACQCERGLESFLSNSLRFRDLAAEAQGGLTLAPNHTAN